MKPSCFGGDDSSMGKSKNENSLPVFYVSLATPVLLRTIHAHGADAEHAGNRLFFFRLEAHRDLLLALHDVQWKRILHVEEANILLRGSSFHRLLTDLRPVYQDVEAAFAPSRIVAVGHDQRRR